MRKAVAMSKVFGLKVVFGGICHHCSECFVGYDRGIGLLEVNSWSLAESFSNETSFLTL